MVQTIKCGRTFVRVTISNAKIKEWGKNKGHATKEILKGRNSGKERETKMWIICLSDYPCIARVHSVNSLSAGVSINLSLSCPYILSITHIAMALEADKKTLAALRQTLAGEGHAHDNIWVLT